MNLNWQNKNNQKLVLREKLKKALGVYFFLFIFFVLPERIEAATFYIETNKSQYFKNDIFLAKIIIDTQGERINAVKVDLKFPEKLLKVIDVFDKNSVLKFWPEPPVFSNETGKISFIGGTPHGFEGKFILVTIVFRVISHLDSKTLAGISFEDSSLALLNDGLGTKANLICQRTVFAILPEPF